MCKAVPNSLYLKTFSEKEQICSYFKISEKNKRPNEIAENTVH